MFGIVGPFVQSRGHRVRILTANARTWLALGVLWLVAVAVQAHPVLTQLGQLHGLEHQPTHLGATQHLHDANGDVPGEDAKGAHSLFHPSDVCAHAMISPDVPALGPLIPSQAYMPIAPVLALAQRSTHPLRPPIA